MRIEMLHDGQSAITITNFWMYINPRFDSDEWSNSAFHRHNAPNSHRIPRRFNQAAAHRMRVVDKRRLGAEGVLVLVTFFWGTTFVVVKDTIETIPVHWFHTLRFGAAALVLWIVVAGELLRRNETATEPERGMVRAGVWLGIALFLMYAFQTFGLLTTTASKSAFITGTSVLFVPLFLLFIPGRGVELRAFVAALIGLAGLLFVTLDDGWETVVSRSFVIGDGLTVICAIAVAVHLLLTKRYTHRFHALPLAAVQLSVVSLMSLACAFIWQEEIAWEYGPRQYVSIAFLALFPSAFNFWALTRMQRYTTEQRTTVIFLFEPVFAAVTAYVVFREMLNAWQWAGAALILLAVVLLETRLLWRTRPAAVP